MDHRAYKQTTSDLKPLASGKWLGHVRRLPGPSWLPKGEELDTPSSRAVAPSEALQC